MDEQRLHELFADPQVRIERRHRILENHADAFAANGSQRGGRTMQQVNAIEERGAAFDAAGRLGDEAHERVAGDGFARA